MARKQSATAAASSLAKHRWAGVSKRERQRVTKSATTAMNSRSHEKRSKQAKKAAETKARKK